MIEAVLFDMDGLLIDSEPLWRQAEVQVFNQVGVPLTDEMCYETTGMRMLSAVEYWYRKYPWKGKTLKAVEQEVITLVIALINDKLTVKSGAIELIKKLHAQSIPMGVCSSSPHVIIESVIATMGLDHLFQILYSADNEEYGKPHPGAYLTCAKTLGIKPENIIVFEDSLNGALAGKSASMKVIAVPEGKNIGSSKFDFCDKTIMTLDEFDMALLDNL